MAYSNYHQSAVLGLLLLAQLWKLWVGRSKSMTYCVRAIGFHTCIIYVLSLLRNTIVQNVVKVITMTV